MKEEEGDEGGIWRRTRERRKPRQIDEIFTREPNAAKTSERAQSFNYLFFFVPFFFSFNNASRKDGGIHSKEMKNRDRILMEAIYDGPNF